MWWWWGGWDETEKGAAKRGLILQVSKAESKEAAWHRRNVEAERI